MSLPPKRVETVASVRCWAAPWLRSDVGALGDFRTGTASNGAESQERQTKNAGQDAENVELAAAGDGT